MCGKRGQSILEYVIVLTAIVVIISAGALTFAGRGDITKGIGKLMDSAGKTITAATGDIANIAK